MRDVTKVMETKLPNMCAVWIDSQNFGGLIHKGTAGYTPFPSLDTEESVEAFNKRRNITKHQSMAMEIGSMMGWDVPGADPDNLKDNN